MFTMGIYIVPLKRSLPENLERDIMTQNRNQTKILTITTCTLIMYSIPLIHFQTQTEIIEEIVKDESRLRGMIS